MKFPHTIFHFSLPSLIFTFPTLSLLPPNRCVGRNFSLLIPIVLIFFPFLSTFNFHSKRFTKIRVDQFSLSIPFAISIWLKINWIFRGSKANRVYFLISPIEYSCFLHCSCSSIILPLEFWDTRFGRFSPGHGKIRQWWVYIFE